MGLGDETRLIAFTGLIFINFKTLSLMLGPLRMSFNTVLYRDACFCEALCFLAMCFLLSTSKHVVNYLPRPMQDFFFFLFPPLQCVFFYRRQQQCGVSLPCSICLCTCCLQDLLPFPAVHQSLRVGVGKQAGVRAGRWVHAQHTLPALDRSEAGPNWPSECLA